MTAKQRDTGHWLWVTRRELCDAQFQMMAEASEGKVSFVSLADLGYE